MSPEDQKFYEDARTMFLTEGWHNFQEEIKRIIDTLRIEYLEDEKAFWMAKGQLTVLNMVAGYETFIHHSEARAEDE